MVEDLEAFRRLEEAIEEKREECQIQQLELMQIHGTLGYLDKKKCKVMKKIGRTPTLTAIDANEKTKIHGAHSVNLDMKTTFENMQDKLRHRLMLARKRLNVCLAQNEDLKKEINAYRSEKNIMRRAFASVEKRIAEIADETTNMEEQIDGDKRKVNVVSTELLGVKDKFDRKKVQMQRELNDLKLQCMDSDEIKSLSEATVKAEAALAYSKRPGVRRKSKEKKLKKKLNGIQFGALDGDNWKMGQIRYQRELWARIHKATGIDDVDELVASFTDIENRRAKWVHDATSLVQLIQGEELKSRQLEAEKAKQVAAQTEALKSWRQTQIRQIKQDLLQLSNVLDSADKLTAINKRKLEEASAPICFLYRLLSNPVLCKALDERMSDTHQIPAKRFSGTIEQQNLDAHAHTVIRAHLHKREKLRAFMQENGRLPSTRYSSSRRRLAERTQQPGQDNEIGEMMAFLEQRIGDLVYIAETLAPQRYEQPPDQLMTHRPDLPATGLLAESIEAARITIPDMAVAPPVENLRTAKQRRHRSTRGGHGSEPPLHAAEMRAMAAANFAGIEISGRPIKKKSKGKYKKKESK